MKIAIGADHAGYELKNEIIKYLKEEGYDIIDYGTNSKESVDYPDFAKAVSYAVRDNLCQFGILVCYTGIGMSIASNKVNGIRAALVNSVENATLTREHNNANVLCLSSKDTNVNLAKEIVRTFLTTAFTYGRHERRVNKIMELEHAKNNE